MKFIFRFLIIFIVFLLSAQKAEAYLDPGGGSFIFQIIISVVLGSVFVIKLKFKQFKKFISNIFKKKKDDSNPNN